MLQRTVVISTFPRYLCVVTLKFNTYSNSTSQQHGIDNDLIQLCEQLLLCECWFNLLKLNLLAVNRVNLHDIVARYTVQANGKWLARRFASKAFCFRCVTGSCVCVYRVSSHQLSYLCEPVHTHTNTHFVCRWLKTIKSEWKLIYEIGKHVLWRWFEHFYHSI